VNKYSIVSIELVNVFHCFILLFTLMVSSEFKNSLNSMLIFIL